MKPSSTEFILLLAVLITLGLKFGPAIQNRNPAGSTIKGDFVQPNYHAPHPSTFPYIEH